MKVILLSFILLLTLPPLFSCKKSNSASPGNTPAVITGISPGSGVGGTVITIMGDHFSTVANTTVTINGIPARVLFTTADSLMAIVPRAAGSGAVSIIIDGITVTGSDFTYIWQIGVSTLAGSGLAGNVNGSAAQASFNGLSGMAFDKAGNLYVCDANNNQVRKITPDGTVSTFAGTGGFGLVDGPGATAKFLFPNGLLINRSGNLHVADEGNFAVRSITPAGMVSTLTGGKTGYNDGPPATAEFAGGEGITTDAQGNLYVADDNNHRIRKITIQ